jgi:hypothetical protein
MRGTHHKNAVILACSVHEKKPKEGFQKWPPGGKNVGQMAMNFGLQGDFARGYPHTKFEVSRSSGYETCHANGRRRRRTPKRHGIA